MTQTGVTHVVFLQGINDIGLPVLLSVIGVPTPEISAEAIIEGHQQLINRARASGLVVIGGTLTPSGGAFLPGYNDDNAEAKRQAVNEWIRNSGAYDVVIDFDEALRDPDNPALMRSDLSADGLHPNSDGYQVMAETALGAIAGQLATKRFEGI